MPLEFILKIFFLSLFSVFLGAYITWEVLIRLLTLTLILFISRPVITNTLTISFIAISLRNISFLLTFLIILTFFWSVRYSSYLTFNKSGYLLNLLVLTLVRVLLLFFYVTKLLIFYVAFELSILPIFLIILGWGYQSERLSASLRIIFYTLTASIPLLAILLYSQTYFSSTYIENFFNLTKENFGPAAIFSMLFFLMAFAVKLPMFGVHLWLPKAHVEAPVLGSMVLAAILLKLGSYGLWLFFQISTLPHLANVWMSISLIGAILVRLLCLRLRDLKIIIAYSSVGHIGLLMAALRINNSVGARGSLIIILAHGATSSAMFLIAYLVYQANHSRSLLLTKGVLGWSATLPLLWFLVLMSNIASPPTFNLIAELILIMNLTLVSPLNVLPLILVILIRTAYTLIIYSSSTQGTIINFSSTSPTSRLASLRIFNHLAWRFFMILAIDTIVL